MEDKPKKHSFDLTKDDQDTLGRIVRFLEKTQGSVTNTTALRFALRKAAKGLPK